MPRDHSRSVAQSQNQRVPMAPTSRNYYTSDSTLLQEALREMESVDQGVAAGQEPEHHFISPQILPRISEATPRPIRTTATSPQKRYRHHQEWRRRAARLHLHLLMPTTTSPCLHPRMCRAVLPKLRGQKTMTTTISLGVARHCCPALYLKSARQRRAAQWSHRLWWQTHLYSLA